MTRSPWIAHAETTLPKEGNPIIQNPQTFTSGLVGEVSLPYTVPACTRLVINYFSIEGIWGAAMWPWLGNGNFDAGSILHTFTAPDLNIPQGLGPMNDGSKFGQLPGTREWHPCFVLPAGAIFNLGLAAFHQSNSNWVYGWVVSGELQDVAA